MMTLGRIVFALLVGIQAQAKKTPLSDLNDQMRIIDKSISLTRQKIKENRDLETLPDLYMTLADFQIQKATISFSLKREKSPKTPIGELDSTSEKRLKEDAVETYNQVVTRFPVYHDLDKALYFMAHEYADLEQLEKSIQTYKKLIDQLPKSKLWEAAQFAIGNYYFEKKDFTFAVEQFSKILQREQNPYTQLAQFRIGWCYVNLSHWNEAFSRFELVFTDQSKIASASMPGMTAVWDVREEALISSVWPYSELTTTELAKRLDLANPIQFYRAHSPDEMVYLKVLSRLARRLEIKKRHRESAQALYFALQLTPRPEDKLPVLEDFYALNRTEKLSLWPSDYPAQIKSTLESASPAIKNKYEVLVRDVATELHSVAKATKRPEDLHLAIDMYEIYLYLYPKSPKAKEMQVNLAEASYGVQALIPAAFSYWSAARDIHKDRALVKSSLQAFMEGLKATDKLSRLDRLQGQAGFERLSKSFIKDFPNDPDVPSIEFNQAKLIFDQREFAKARKLLHAFISKYPRSEEIPQAAMLLLDSYYQENDLKNLALEGQRLLNKGSFKPEAERTIKDLVENAKLRRVRNLAGDFGSKQYSDNLLKLANQSSDQSLGQTALYEAFLSAKARRDSRTYAIGETYLSKYGQTSEARMVDNEMIQLAIHSADFRLAARYLEWFSSHFPKDSEADGFLNQAEIIYRHLLAIDDLKRITGKTGHLQSLGEALYARRQWRELGEVANQIPGLKGAYFQGLALYRQGNKATALPLLNRAADMRADAATNEPALSGHARFIVAQEEFERIKGLLRPQPMTAALVKSSAAEVLGLETTIRHVFETNQARWIVASLYLSGQLQLSLADFLEHGTPPVGMTAAQLQNALQSQINRAKLQAQDAFSQCHKLAVEKRVYTRYSSGCSNPTAQFIYERDEFPPFSPMAPGESPELLSLREGVAKAPGDAKAWFNLAEKLFAVHAYSECELVLSHMVDSLNDPHGWAAMGIVRLHLGDLDGAEQALAKATELQAGEPLAQAALNRLNQRFGLANGRAPASRPVNGRWTHPWLE